MDPIPAWVRRPFDMWDLRVLVLMSLTFQIILSLLGSRRKYISSAWISITLWSAYLLADWVATVALGKLSDADNGNTLGAIWAPLLLLHLGGPDTITAYSLEDTHLWMRHLFGLLFQFFVAVYVILMSWEHSWFSFMSIPALVAGFIKYGERTWVLFSVSHDKSGEIIPFDRRDDNKITSEDNNYIRSLDVAHRLVKGFKSFTQFFEMQDNDYHPEVVGDISVLWEGIEVEMGLMFDLLYTKAPINFSKRGLILRCLTFSCTVAVLIGLVLQLISTGEGGEKWQKVDIVITGVLLVGAVALEIYAIVSLCLFSDWTMLWLIKSNIGKRLVQFRTKKAWLFFLPRQYQQCKTVRQFDLVDYWVKNRSSLIYQRDQDVESDQKVGRKKLGSLLGIKRRVEDFKVKMLIKYATKTAVIVPSVDLFKDILYEGRRLRRPNEHHRRDVEENAFWEKIFEQHLEMQIFLLFVATESFYNLDTPPDVASDQNNGDSSNVNRELCKTLSRYMMYILIKRSSMLPIGDARVIHNIMSYTSYIGDVRDHIGAAGRNYLVGSDAGWESLMDAINSQQKDKRWEMLKFMWMRILCYAASKGQTNEHFRGLSQGGELLTFLWFFLPLCQKFKDPDESGVLRC